jgi:hypothetical protein
MAANVPPVCRVIPQGFVLPPLPTNTLSLQIISLFERSFQGQRDSQVALFCISAMRVVVYTLALAASILQGNPNYLQSLIIQCLTQSFLHPLTPFIAQPPVPNQPPPPPAPAQAPAPAPAPAARPAPAAPHDPVDENLPPEFGIGFAENPPLDPNQWPLNAPYYDEIAPLINACLFEASEQLKFSGKNDAEKLFPYYTYAESFLATIVETLLESGKLTKEETESLEGIDFSTLVIPGQVAQLLEVQPNSRFVDRLNERRSQKLINLQAALSPEKTVPIVLAILFSKELKNPELQELKKDVCDLGQIFYTGEYWNQIHGIERVRQDYGMEDDIPEEDPDDLDFFNPLGGVVA